MKTPSRIIDLHTHLFNARFLPMEGVISDRLGRPNSRVAGLVARLLYRITGSSATQVLESLAEKQGFGPASDESYVDALWQATELKLEPLLKARALLDARPMSTLAATMPDGDVQELIAIIDELAEIDLDAELSGASPLDKPKGEVIRHLPPTSWLERAEAVVKRVFRYIRNNSIPEMIDDFDSILQFFLVMLQDEKDIAQRIFATYGNDIAPVTIVHYLMDMQHAYERNEPAYYAFPDEQLARMQDLHERFDPRVIGFSAFDPRRADWEKLAEKAWDLGFRGYKFYPAMGYAPNEPEGEIRNRILAFFDFCIKRDAPIFAHCTPTGFETSKKLGWNAHPLNWKAVLFDRPNLRLCLGHAGGGDITNENGNRRSRGWQCPSAEWDSRSIENFARHVVDLCITYENVYCEVGHFSWLFKASNLANFKQNFRNQLGKKSNYAFSKKIAYGSDWHMPGVVGGLRRYLEIFLAIAQEQSDPEFVDDFFWRNATQFLGENA